MNYYYLKTDLQVDLEERLLSHELFFFPFIPRLSKGLEAALSKTVF